ncbi:MAG: hypothetical protein RRZ24_04970 [Clostridia bacterium]
MKKIIALFIAALVIMSLAACAGTGIETTPSATAPVAEEPTATAAESAPAVEAAPSLSLDEITVNYAYDRSWPEETLKIGIVLFNPTDSTWLSVKEYYDYLASIFNIEFIYSETISSPEEEFKFVDSCAAAGCKGIYAYYNASGPSIIMEATNLGMYYVGVADYYDRFLDNPYYVGGYSFVGKDGLSGDYTAGYALGYNLAKQDVKHIVYASGETKVKMMNERAQGFYDGVAAAQAEGVTALFDPAKDVIGGWPDAPTFPALQTAALTSDYDAVGSATDIAYWFQPVEDIGKQMKMACIGSVSDTYKSYVENGIVSVIVYDAPEIVHGAPMIMLINCCTGHPELAKNADGTPRLQHVVRWTIDSPGLFNEIYNKHKAGEYYVSIENTVKLLGGLDPDASIVLMDQVYDISMEQALGK